MLMWHYFYIGLVVDRNINMRAPVCVCEREKTLVGIVVK